MSRGINRKSKVKTPKAPDERITAAQAKALDYLENELELCIGVPGNSAEVMRIMKALAALRSSNGNSGPTDTDALRRNFSFMEDQEGG